MFSSSTRRLIACVTLPAIVSLVFLLVVSFFVFGHAFRPGLWAEVLLVLYASAVLMQFQRRGARAAIFNTVLLLVFYGAYLTKYLVLREGMATSDLDSITALLAVLPSRQRLGLGLVGLVVIALVATNLARPRLLPTTVLLAPLLAYVIGCHLAPATVFGLLERARRTSLIVALEPWRDGPLVTAIRQPPRVRTMRQFLRQGPQPAHEGADIQRRAQALASLPAPRRSVHMIIMESFVDPLNFRTLRCPSDPVDTRFRRWLTESDSIALAATFGGISARSEFEVLCGAPSYERLGIDFMALRGAGIPCLPDLLRRLGYLTMSNSSGPSSFFNHNGAYPALGFERSHSGTDFVMKEADMDGEVLSDAAYFTQVLRWVLPAIQEGRPVLNYILTWAGHYPFDLNPQTHPPFCTDDTLAGKVANAAHYNSKAVADYVEAIEALDPDALIVVLADHLPPLGFAGSGYREGDYRLRFHGGDAPPFWEAHDPSWLESRATMLWVRMARQPVSLGIVPHYLLSEALLDLLTEGAYCRATTCLRKMPIINRPNATIPVFTTPDAFPLPVCANASDDDPLCRTAREMNGVLEAEYEALLRTGLQESEVALPVSSGE